MRQRLLFIAMGLVVMCVVGDRGGWQLASADPPAKAMRVAVVAFQNASPDDAGLDSLGKGLQSMITTDLARVGALELIERDRLQDIQAELSLARSRMIDGKTAARIGKLAGATHLLAGTFTVHGARMRIDARLFAVERGNVLLAEEITGDKEAFFELEKALVDKLVAALGVKLAAKERAQVARIHTADFEAFRRFSQGVAHFDDKRYQEAIEALRQATAMDADFDLARITLAEYERIAAEIRARADNIAATSAEVERLKADRQAQGDAAMVARLFEIADRAGKEQRARRLGALLVLLSFYESSGYRTGRLNDFWDHQDGFLIKRMAEGLSKRYLGEALNAFPEHPMFGTGEFINSPPQSMAELEDTLETTIKESTGVYARSPAKRQEELLRNLVELDRAFVHLVVDLREEIRLRELALERAIKLGAEPYEQRRALEVLALRYRQLGELDASTAAFARQSAATQDPPQLEEIALEIDWNRELAQALARVRLKRQLKEYLGTWKRGYGKPSIDWSLFEDQKPGPRLLYELANVRSLLANEYWFFGDEPSWVIEGQDALVTGERVDRLRSNELRYYERGGRFMRDVLVAMGAMPRGDVEASFTLVFQPAADWWPRQSGRPKATASHASLGLDTGRPEVGFLFGLRDLERSSAHDDKVGESRFANPTRATAVRVTADAIQLVDLGEPAPSRDLRKSEMTMKVLAEKPAKLAAEQRLAVKIRVQGKQVRVQVGRGPQHTFQLPADAAAAGFTGFHVRGRGYVSIANPKIRSL